MPVVVTSWTGTSTSTHNTLVNKVASLYGIEVGYDSELGQRALEWLDDSVRDLNMGLYEFNKVSQTGIVLTAAQQYVAAATEIYRPYIAYLVRTSDSMAHGPLTGMDWPDFKRNYPDAVNTSQPISYATFNYESEGRVYLGPTPDTDTANGFTLSIDYYRRIPKVSDVAGGDALNVPEEVEVPLLYGAYKRAAMHFGQPNDVAMYESLWFKSLDRLKNIDRKQPSNQHRFRLVDTAPKRLSPGWGSVWIKID